MLAWLRDLLFFIKHIRKEKSTFRLQLFLLKHLLYCEMHCFMAPMAVLAVCPVRKQNIPCSASWRIRKFCLYDFLNRGNTLLDIQKSFILQITDDSPRAIMLRHAHKLRHPVRIAFPAENKNRPPHVSLPRNGAP